MAASAHIAPIVYLAPMAARPRSYTFEPPPGVPWRTGKDEMVAVAIDDARSLKGGGDLDREGFALVAFEPRFSAWDDVAALKRDYYPEASEFVACRTGAPLVVAFDHNLRSSAVTGRAASGVREPAKRAHGDFTAQSGGKRAREELAAAGIDPGILARRRFALVNLWRPIRGPVLVSPLALCDARTVAPDDLVLTDLVHPNRMGEIYSLRHNPAHHWYYVPGMRTDEALLIKCFDSDEAAAARFTPHGAFEDPTSPPEAPARLSIEGRTPLMFDARGAGAP